MKKYFSSLKSDLPAGIVVFLVALPLCLGIALASGAPFFSGMIAGIVGGIVVASISNSQLSVSGPAAGLAAIVMVSIQELGAFNIFLLAVVFAGIIQVILGFLKAGTISNYFPSNVIKGMLTAIGILIILKQIPHAFGYNNMIQNSLDFSTINFLKPLQHISFGATIIALLSLFILIIWEKPFVKNKIGFIPGGLVAVFVSVILNEFFVSTNSILAITSNKQLVDVPIANTLDQFIAFFTFPDFSQISNPKIYTIAVTLAIVASIETLLSIEAVDNIDPHKRISSTNLELKAQGIGNIVSGLIGGLPITSVIVRSSANVNAKAETKVSAIFHGVLLLVCVAFIPKYLNKIPLATLAAILLTVGYKLTKISIYKEMFKNGKYQWIPFIVTVLVIVFTDLLKGVAVGLVVSVFFILKGNLENGYFFHKENHHSGDAINIKLSEEVSFLNKASIKQTLAHLPEKATVNLDATNTKYIDFDILELIKNFKNTQAVEKNITLNLIGFKDAYKIEDNNNVQSVH